MRDTYRRLFGEGWGNALSETLDEKTFTELGMFIKSERQKTTVYPPQEDIFKAFRLTPFENVKVILLGMDPYVNEDQATGLSFAVPRDKNVPPSLRIIRDEIEKSHNRLLLDFDTSLEGWAKDGVLMLNAALTVRAKESGSHMKEWQPFTTAVINALNKKVNIRWILLGKNAQEFDHLIDMSHIVFKAPHPMAEIYKPNCGFIGSGVFRKVNQSLSVLDEKQIDWFQQWMD